MGLRILCVLIGILGGLAAQDLDQGIAAYKSGKYPEAVEAFRRAVSADPNGINGRLYLGTALMTQYIPGSSTPGNQALAMEAEAEFKNVLGLDPQNKTALASIASLIYQEAQAMPDLAAKQAKLDVAAEWYQKLINADPRSKEAYYSLGVIDWLKWYPTYQNARLSLGMKPEDPGPLPSYNTRQDLRLRFGPVIEDGLRNLQAALDIDPKYDDAMAYMNLLIRERADLRDTHAEYQADIAVADSWVQKTLDTKKAKAEAATVPANPLATYQRIRVGGNVQAANLVYKVTPVYPVEAKRSGIQGTVRFTAVIGKDGHVASLQLVAGYPMLAEAAQAAVEQWIYKPTLLNGQPVEVVTQIDVNFTLADGPAGSRLRVPGSQQSERLVFKPEPVYPPLAKQARIQGTVRFTAIIGTDGRVKNVQLVSGHPLLVESARDAVVQYVYRPSESANGQPVEVVTQIDVNFTLSYYEPPPPGGGSLCVQSTVVQPFVRLDLHPNQQIIFS